MKKTMMRKMKNKRIKIMNNKLKDLWNGISSRSKNLSVGNKKNSEEKAATRDKAKLFQK